MPVHQLTRRSLLTLSALPLLSAPGKSLFDGVTTQGWRGVGTAKFPSRSWTVSDSCLKSEVIKPAFEDIRTVEEFADFELRFEWKIAPGGNSGVKYLIYREDRWKAPGSNEYHARGRGFEFQLADDDAEPDAAAHPQSRSGALYGFVAPSRRVTNPVGEFNTARIVRRGMAVEHWINAVRVLHIRLDSADLRERMRARKMPEDFPRRSPIVLQNHSSEAWFRNLQITPL